MPMDMELPNGLFQNDVWHIEIGIVLKAEALSLVVLAHNVVY